MHLTVEICYQSQLHPLELRRPGSVCRYSILKGPCQTGLVLKLDFSIGWTDPGKLQ